MNHTNEMLRLFPLKRIKPVDGMAVTADVWEEAHDYHRNLMRYHALFQHGTGIVTGLEVIARDPADELVYVLPGIAIDSVGRTILMAEPFAYNFEQGEGTLYLLLTHQEGRPQNSSGREDAPHYVMSGYGLEAVSQRPSTPFVELARIERSAADAPILNAAEYAHPQVNQIDLRYREEIGAQESAPITIGVAKLRNASDQEHRGIGILARSLRQQGRRRVWADMTISSLGELDRYALIYMMIDDPELFNQAGNEEYETKVLYEYLHNGGTILVEMAGDTTEMKGARFAAMTRQIATVFGVYLAEVEGGHPLLEAPHFFTALPDCSRSDGIGKVAEGGGLIISTCGLGRLWAGQGTHGPVGREAIRSAMELGDNILTYSIERRLKHGRHS